MQDELKKLLLSINLGESLMQIEDSYYYVIYRKAGDIYQIDRTGDGWKTGNISINNLGYNNFKDLVNSLNFK